MRLAYLTIYFALIISEKNLRFITVSRISLTQTFDPCNFASRKHFACMFQLLSSLSTVAWFVTKSARARCSRESKLALHPRGKKSLPASFGP